MNNFFDTVDARRLVKSATFAVVLLAIFLLLQSLNAFKEWRNPSAAFHTLSMTGTGEAFVTPDIATFSYSVTADAKTVTDAQATVTKNSNAILAALKGMGIDEKDIKTTDYSAYPKYTYQTAVCPASAPSSGGNSTAIYCPPGRQVADGYTVTNSVTVKVRKTDDAGKALAAVGDNGGTGISGLSFTVDDPDAVQAEARDKAVQDAKAKAETLAKSLGVDLGHVVSFQESGGGAPYPIYAAMAAGASDSKSIAPTLPTGQNKVTDTVTIEYEID